MSLEQIYYLAEITGVAVVAVTLIILTMQIRQNSRQQRVAALREALLEMVHGFAQITSDEEKA